MNGFLEYVPGSSLIHRMNPVAKLLFAVVFAITCFCTGNLIFLCAMLAIAIACAVSCGMMRQTFGLMKAVFVFSLILAILLLLTTPAGDHLVSLPWGYIGTGSILAAVTTIVRLEAAAIPLFLTFYVTKVSDLSNSVVKVLHVPYRYAFMNDMKSIMETQTARGIEFDTGGIVNKVRLMVPLCVPLLVSSVRKTNSSAIAAEVRGFNLRTRASGFKEYPFAAADIVALLIAIVLMAGAICITVLL